MAKPDAHARALSTIFSELNATTEEDRSAVMRGLQPFLKICADYKEWRERRPTRRQFDEWDAKVRSHAGKLASLLSVEWASDEHTALAGRLRALEKRTADDKPRRGRPEADIVHRMIVIAICTELYQTRIGKPVGAGRRNNLSHRKKQGAPVGPFFRLVKAAFALAGDEAGDEAVLAAIRKWQGYGKRVAARGRGLITPQAAE